MRTLQEIKRLRTKLNLTQKELSIRSGVSQSLIAKIEAGRVEPTYTKALELFKALEELRNQEELKAKEVMTKKVITVDAEDKVKEVIKLMKRGSFSQLPVLSKGIVCGLITENIILNKMLETSGKISYFKARDLMEEAPPIVPCTTGLRTLLELLKNSPTILVMEKGQLKGIISKSDLLGKAE